MKKIIMLLIVFVCMAVFSYAEANCSALVSDITIQVDSEPYVNEKVSFLAFLPDAYKTEEVRCWTYVSRDGNIQQTNPQMTEYSNTFFSFPKQTETREYFSAQNGMVNAYFTQKNLVAYTEFILGVKCVSMVSGDMIVGEKCITPYYKELNGITARSVWAVENMDILVIVVILGLFAVGMLVMYWKSNK